jgi:hypothetical protein
MKMANPLSELQKLNASIGSPDDKMGDPTMIGLLKKLANWKEEAKAEAAAAAKQGEDHRKGFKAKGR